MRVFGKTGVRLTMIAQGGARMDLFPDMEAARLHVRHLYYELGINYFDCAHSYWGGKSEEVYGGVLPEVRKNVFITTKSPGLVANATKNATKRYRTPVAATSTVTFDYSESPVWKAEREEIAAGRNRQTACHGRRRSMVNPEA